MEVIEEPPVVNTLINDMITNAETENTSTECIEKDVCHKPNGVVESDVAEPAEAEDSEKKDSEQNTTETVVTPLSNEKEENSVQSEPTSETPTTTDEPTLPDNNTEPVSESAISQEKPSKDSAESNTEIDSLVKTVYEEIEIAAAPVVEVPDEEPSGEVGTEETVVIQEISEEETPVDINHEELSYKDGVRFKTEILVEVESNDVKENNSNETNSDEQAAKNILSEFGQSIELSEVLRSSDVTDNVENNNCTGRQEVFNKEELLDILQGKDAEAPENEVIEEMETTTVNAKSREAQLALQQLSRLKYGKKRTRLERMQKPKKSEKKEQKKTENIINVLVQDWDDEETSEIDKPVKLVDKTESDENKIEPAVINKEELLRTSVDSAASEDHSQKSNKSGDEGQPQRRLGRIIKKKVIFDPDNPDTFTKGKSVTKNSEVEKEFSPNKKIKTEASSLRSKSKSPISNKLQWKKPSPKNVKQNKRLTEVDKLLMDEGAVNMIYQLTPEAPKGKKNVKTKAEFIKKLQSSTPDSKEMKFRERKKDSSKYDESDPKKIISGKHRTSLSSSVKSPVCEDFETHSADDSIIYRRHSSSSYSSTCMSPRRLSDVESSGPQNNVKAVQEHKVNKTTEGDDLTNQPTEGFMSDSVLVNNSEIINRDDCISIKEKLNSKLSLALNKRKRESSKIDKPPKQKRMKELVPHDDERKFKYLTLNIGFRLAEIDIHCDFTYNVEVIKELEQVLHYVDARNDISVTLLTSQCGTLCSSLDIRPLLHDDDKTRAKNAFEIADSIRSLLSAVEQHSKLVCAGVWGACWGVGLGLLACSDLALAADTATFSLAESPQHVTMLPGLAAITARCNSLPQSLINDLVVFGRRISASEAQQGGLVSRCLWPDRFSDQLRNIVKDIALQPAPLKKQLLGIRKSGENMSTFLSCLETERDLLVDYWTSVEGQELLRADHANV
ncbi:Chromodomain Y-like protein 2 [Papilio xuthus]|uniref:Chromodomain Y-like protein 2 n=1 Tax=Papilio xuthus TaxID=66420 RepID=A0A194PWF8_PAPXU|nr:Chromodomain Y-like protein 2 [Papilio xuthus]